MKKPISDAQIDGNRRNSTKSTGPRDTTSTRFNATKHGLLAAGITELDDVDEYRNTLSRLNQAYFEELETFLRKRIALTMIRLGRSARLEAEYITGILNPPIDDESEGLFGYPPPKLPKQIDPGLPAPLHVEHFEPLVRTFQRYDTALENKLFRMMHEVERLQRIRQGEKLPAPTPVDVTVHTESRGLESFAKLADKEILEGSLSELPLKRENINSTTAPEEVEASADEPNIYADARGLASFVEPTERPVAEGVESKPSGNGREVRSNITRENRKATQTVPPTEEDEPKS
jgi:hypothetical protein